MEFKKGDKIKWVYYHWLNSKSYTIKTKFGIFIRESFRHRYDGGMAWPEKIAIVQFDGNKSISRVLLNEIEKVC